MAHIMVVCTANICRSPVAETLLRDRLEKEGLADWEVSSAGTWAETGQRAVEMWFGGHTATDHPSYAIKRVPARLGTLSKPERGQHPHHAAPIGMTHESFG